VILVVGWNCLFDFDFVWLSDFGEWFRVREFCVDVVVMPMIVLLLREVIAAECLNKITTKPYIVVVGGCGGGGGGSSRCFILL